MANRAVDRAEARPGQDCRRGRHQAEHDQGPADPEEVDRQRSDEGADRYEKRCQARLSAEDPGEQLLRHEPGGQGMQADVHQGVTDADHEHQPQDDGFVREGAA